MTNENEQKQTSEYSLDQIAVLLWDGGKDSWAARARGSNVFMYDADPDQAIIKCIDARTKEETNE